MPRARGRHDRRSARRILVIRLLLHSGLGRRMVAVPTSERWHDASTPTFGGIGIYCGLVAGIGVASRPA